MVSSGLSIKETREQVPNYAIMPKKAEKMRRGLRTMTTFTRIAQESISFLATTFDVILASDGERYMNISAICNALGLRPGPQKNRIKRTPSLLPGLRMLAVETRGGEQTINCLNIQFIEPWLDGLQIDALSQANQKKFAVLRNDLVALARATFANADFEFASSCHERNEEDRLLMQPVQDVLSPLTPESGTSALLTQMPEHTSLTFADPREPHDYQEQALAAWEAAQMRGSVVLPTGSGKTLIALRAIQLVHRSAIVACPTLDLMHQWFRILRHAFSCEIGVYYGGEKAVLPLTVTTFHSLGDLIQNYGNQAKLLILDEVHHVSSPAFGEGVMMAPAPCRLGLTATYPTEAEQAGGRWRLSDLIGPVVFSLSVDELSGDRLAHYRTERLRVDLTPSERLVYERDVAHFTGYVKRHQLRQRFQARWLHELMRLSASEQEARAAFLAWRRVKRLLATCEGKLRIVDQLLREHVGLDPMLIFTESNDTVYRLSRQYLIPPITHLTPATERTAILDGFHEGRFAAIITSRVLNEGIDVPAAKVAVILGGTTGAREYIQRLGRVLRKAENKHAVLYEIIVRETSEEGKAARRRAAHRQYEEEFYADR
jgi:superfamily II DNA or RNA helicase